MMKGIKQKVKGVGYVVFWKDGYKSKPLRNFGDWQYAAIEFARWLNQPHENQERFERNIELWAKTYNPENKYQAPVINGEFVIFKKQR